MGWRGKVFIVGAIGSAAGGWGPILPLLVVLFFVSHKAFRYLMEIVQDFWLSAVGGGLEYIHGSKPVFYGDDVLKNNQSIVISNHRTALDWMYLWCLAARIGAAGYLRIVLKDTLAHVPLYGWVCQLMNFLFLKRAWLEDRDHMTRMLHHYKTTCPFLMMLIFPEGTDFCGNAKKRHLAFVEKSGKPLTRYTMYPRSKGLGHAIRTMDELQYLYDVTIAYEGVIPRPVNLSTGPTPTKVHMLIQRYDISKLPRTTSEVHEWLSSVWASKEKALQYFYSSPDGEDGEENDKIVTPYHPNARCTFDGFKAPKILGAAPSEGTFQQSSDTSEFHRSIGKSKLNDASVTNAAWNHYLRSWAFYACTAIITCGLWYFCPWEFFLVSISIHIFCFVSTELGARRDFAELNYYGWPKSSPSVVQVTGLLTLNGVLSALLVWAYVWTGQLWANPVRGWFLFLVAAFLHAKALATFESLQSPAPKGVYKYDDAESPSTAAPSPKSR